jgi:4-hydroxy-3-polyprenylbenzoate decarboxylase
MIEGPFGNHTGYYDCASPAPVICIDRVSMRNGAIYPCTLVGPPPRENCCLAELTERTLLPLLQYDHPWVVNVHMPVEGIFHRAAIVAVAPDCGLPQEKICTALRSSALLKNSRLLILVDKQDHLSDLRYIYWRVVNASRDNRTCHVTGHNILYDARLTGGSLRVDTSVAMESHVKARWHEYGLNATT